MADKKKTRNVLLNVKDLDEDRLDKALDRALDTLFGPDEKEEEDQAAAEKAWRKKTARPGQKR